MEKEIRYDSSLELYAQYTSLPIQAIVELMSGLSTLSDNIKGMHAELAKIKVSTLPDFEVTEVHTGESIKFTFGERWIPSISSNEESDIIIDVPKKLGIPLLIGYLILSGTQKMLDIKNKHLDNQIKIIDTQLKETELQKSILQSKDAISNLKGQSSEFIFVIQKNEIYQDFKINGVSIIHPKQGQDKRRKD